MYKQALGVLGSRLRANEFMLVKQGIKKAVRLSVYDKEKKNIEEFLEKNSLSYEYSDFRVVQEQDVGKGGFSNKGYLVSSGSKGFRYIYISEHKDIAMQSKRYEHKNDIRSFGKVLGYPDCCIDFFIREMKEAKKRQNDFIIPAIRSRQGDYRTNVLARYFDISILSHFPCSFNCKESIYLADRYIKILRPDEETFEYLKSTVIYSEYDGIFLFPGMHGNIVDTSSFYYTTKNQIFELFERSKDFEILSDTSVRLGKHIIENVHVLQFK